MAKSMDDNLNLEQLLKRVKEMDPNIRLRIYYDPAVRWFYINFVGVMDFWITNDASFLFECEAGRVRQEIEILISIIVKRLDKEAAS